MSCPRTPHLLTEYFADNVSGVALEEMRRHLEQCDDCAGELAALQSVRKGLGAWKQQETPHWNRTADAFGRTPLSQSATRFDWFWRWLPATASLAMLVLFITSAQFTRTEDGFHIVFGQIQAELDQAQLDSLSAAMESSQIESLRAVLASLETVRAEEHRLLTQAVMEQTREFSAENLDLIVTWVEQQHRLNMESLQAGFEQLLDSDMNTLLAMEQLASFVQYREEVR